MDLNRYMIVGLLLLLTLGFSAQLSAAESHPQADDGVQVMQAFSATEVQEGKAVVVADKTKGIVMFAMGITLLVLLLATAALGVAMGVYGKPVFLAHMVCAGLSLTLALAHTVVALVWFFPF